MTVPLRTSWIVDDVGSHLGFQKDTGPVNYFETKHFVSFVLNFPTQTLIQSNVISWYLFLWLQGINGYPSILVKFNKNLTS